VHAATRLRISAEGIPYPREPVGGDDGSRLGRIAITACAQPWKDIPRYWPQVPESQVVVELRVASEVVV
jgi:hypothetical protein